MTRQHFSARNITLALTLVFLTSSIAPPVLPATQAPSIMFTRLTTEVGFNEVYSNSTMHMLGVNWIDFNNDGWPDLFVVNDIDFEPHLYRNNRDGTFTLFDIFLPPLPNVRMTGSIFGDVDNDGDEDIYIFTDNHDWNGVLSSNQPDGPRNLFLRNLYVENGNTVSVPLFVQDAGAAGLFDMPPVPLGGTGYLGYRTYSGGFLDYDRDGWLDVLTGHFVPQAAGEVSNQNRLYRNLGDGTFEDTTMSSGMDLGGTDNLRSSLAFIAAHLDLDRDPDMYVVNAIEPSPAHNDVIYRNIGGVFTNNTGASPGVGDDAGAGMGIDVGDANGDGKWDIYITDLVNNGVDTSARNVLYLGNGDGTFQENSAGLHGAEGTDSWGVNFFDVDHDGDEDIFVSTMGQPGLPDLLLENDGTGDFTDVSATTGFTAITNQRGSAIADFDRDGDLDIAVISSDQGLQLYRNDSTNLGNWLQLDLQGTASNRSAIGAIVKVRFTDSVIGTKTVKRQVKGGSSAHSQDSLVVHVGVGDAAVVDGIRILWPTGGITIIQNVPVNQIMTIIQ